MADDYITTISFFLISLSLLFLPKKKKNWGNNHGKGRLFGLKQFSDFHTLQCDRALWAEVPCLKSKGIHLVRRRRVIIISAVECTPKAQLHRWHVHWEISLHPTGESQCKHQENELCPQEYPPFRAQEPVPGNTITTFGKKKSFINTIPKKWAVGWKLVEQEN